jgi:hypothetical protein
MRVLLIQLNQFLRIWDGFLGLIYLRQQCVPLSRYIAFDKMSSVDFC